MKDGGLRERLVVDLVRWLPKSTFGQVAGFLGHRTIPRRLRSKLYTRIADRLGIDLGTVELPLTEYPSFGAFFSRGMRAGSRSIDPNPDVAVSPVDGVVVESGSIIAGRMLQAKGMDYTLRALLLDEAATRTFDRGSYITLYLAPSDYHRIHAPVGGTVTGYQHIPGAFFPVNPPAVRHVSGLFARNERLTTYLDSPLGQVAVIKVAAAGVGHISVAYDRAVRTRRKGASGRVVYPEPKPLRKGDELGTFHLGSTVIVLFERQRVTLRPLASGARILIGQPIGTKATSAAGDVAA